MIKHIAEATTKPYSDPTEFMFALRVRSASRNKLVNANAFPKIEQLLMQMEALKGLKVSVTNELKQQRIAVKVQGQGIKEEFIAGLVRNAVEGKITELIGKP